MRVLITSPSRQAYFKDLHAKEGTNYLHNDCFQGKVQSIERARKLGNADRPLKKQKTNVKKPFPVNPQTAILTYARTCPEWVGG